MATKHVQIMLCGEALTLATRDSDTGDYHWNHLWPSALGLCEHLLRHHRTSLRAKRVLELGTGVGLVGLVAARLGAALTLNDIDEEALAVARENLATQGLDVPELAPFDWSRPPELAPFDLILGSDVVYEDWLVEPVVACLERLLAPGGEAWLADPIRYTFTNFLDRLRERGFEHRQDLVDIEHGGRPHTIGVYTVRRRQLRSRA